MRQKSFPEMQGRRPKGASLAFLTYFVSILFKPTVPMLGVVIVHLELPSQEVYAELLLHRIAIHKETKPTVPEEAKIVIYPQNFVLEVSDFIKPHQVAIRKLPKQKIQTCKEPGQCVACLVDTQEALLRLASVCEKPPEQ